MIRALQVTITPDRTYRSVDNLQKISIKIDREDGTTVHAEEFIELEYFYSLWERHIGRMFEVLKREMKGNQ